MWIATTFHPKSHSKKKGNRSIAIASKFSKTVGKIDTHEFSHADWVGRERVYPEVVPRAVRARVDSGIRELRARSGSKVSIWVSSNQI